MSHDDSWVEQLANEHTMLETYLDQLDDLIAAPDDHTIQALRPLLHEVFDRCRTHMELEERDGYMIGLVQTQPHLTNAVNELRDEHDVLLSAMTEITVSVDQSEDMDRLEGSFVPQIREWLDQMRRHEHRENELVLEAFNQDIGTKD